MAAKKDEVVTHGEGFADVKLSRPLDVAGNKISVLRMREPTVNDQLVASETKGAEAMKEIVLFANLCDLAPEDVRKLPLRDYARVQQAFTGFID